MPIVTMESGITTLVIPGEVTSKDSKVSSKVSLKVSLRVDSTGLNA